MLKLNLTYLFWGMINQQFKLGDLCSKITDGAHHSPKACEEGFPMFSVKDMRQNNFDYSKTKRISEIDYIKLIKSGCQPVIDDILIAKDGSVMKHVFYVKEKPDYVLLSSIAILRPIVELVHPTFLVYSIKNPITEKDIRTNYVSGSGVPRIVLKDFAKVNINLPPLPEQKAIAHILGTLDDKIELNRKMNETLEAMAQTMFKSWFVDFDPVIDNAIAQGNEIPEELKAKAERRKAVLESGKYKPLPKGIKALFPSSFEYDDELGKWIPEGWESHELGAITTELRRGVSPKYTEEEVGVLVLNQRCIRNHEINFSLARKNDPTKKKVDGRFLEVGDVLVNSTGTGTLGRIANVISLEKPTIVDSHVTVVRNDKSKIATKYFNCLMFSIESHIEAMGEGSTGQTELSRARLSELTVLVASRNIQDLIEVDLESIYLKKDANKYFNQNLIKTQDLLLSQLISGKTCLPESFIKQFESQKETVS